MSQFQKGFPEKMLLIHFSGLNVDGPETPSPVDDHWPKGFFVTSIGSVGIVQCAVEGGVGEGEPV